MQVATEQGFDFDSPEYSYQKTPAAKAIPSPAGLWIAHDNQELANWEKGRELEGAIAHQVSTSQYDQEGEAIKIPGALFKQPKLLVIGRSPLLAGAKRKVDRVWRKGDKELGFQSARRYLLLFLDTNSKPLHLFPLQLTAWGVFQLEFDKSLINFRTLLEAAYASGTGKPKQSKTPLWHAMGVFAPKFKTEVRGQTKENSSPCCVTTDFAKPTAENWEKLCVGRSAIAPDIATLHNTLADWWERAIKVKPNLTEESTPQEEVEDYPF